jgi:hypothetical protein
MSCLDRADSSSKKVVFTYEFRDARQIIKLFMCTIFKIFEKDLTVVVTVTALRNRLLCPNVCTARSRTFQ